MKNAILIGVDAGCFKSAAVCVDTAYNPPKVLWSTQIKNDEMLTVLKDNNASTVVFESIVAYGSVGQEVLDTTFWVGRFWSSIENVGKAPIGISRLNVRKLLLNSGAGNDAAIRQAVIKIYGKDSIELKGITTHCWQALGTLLAAYKAYENNCLETYLWDPFYTASDLFKERRENRKQEKIKKQERILGKGSKNSYLESKLNKQ
jgi:hypothetical protein